MANPYQDPKGIYSGPPAQPPMPGGPAAGSAVQHVRMVAGLMIALGILEILLVFAIAGFAWFAAERTSRTPIPSEVQAMQQWTPIFFGAGLATFALAILHIWAGLQNLSFSGYTLGIVAIGSSGLGILISLVICFVTCLYFPVSAGMLAYGLSVYLQKDVADAFQMGESGRSVEEILHLYR